MKKHLMIKIGLWLCTFIIYPVTSVKGMDDAAKAARDAKLKQSARVAAEKSELRQAREPQATDTKPSSLSRVLPTLQEEGPKDTKSYEEAMKKQIESRKAELESMRKAKATQPSARETVMEVLKKAREEETPGQNVKRVQQGFETFKAGLSPQQEAERKQRMEQAKTLGEAHQETLSKTEEDLRKEKEAAEAERQKRLKAEEVTTGGNLVRQRQKELLEAIGTGPKTEAGQRYQTKAKGPGTDTPFTYLSIPKSVADVSNNHKKFIAAGIGGGAVLGLAGLFGVLFGVLSDKKEGETEKVVPTPEPDEGTIPPTVYPPADENDPGYQEEIKEVSEFFSDIEIKFQEALESTSYFDKSFKIEGSITIGQAVEKIGIIYNFENELGTPFTPFLVTLLPQDVSGYELDTSKLLTQIQDGKAKELLSMLLKPKTSFIFMIKTILLINTTLRDETKNDAEKVDFILSEITKLYSRLILTPGLNPAPTAILSEMPEALKTVLIKKSIKMYAELLTSFRDPEKSAFTEKISQMRQIKTYDKKTTFVITDIVPLIQKNLTYSEKKLLIHALTRHLSDLPKATKDLAKNTKALNSMLTKVVSKMEKKGLEESTITAVTKLISTLKSKKTIKKPELEISSVLYKDAIPLMEAMDVLFAHFAKIQSTQFEGDPDYLYFDFMLGKNATKYRVQAILLRCMTETLQAEQILSKTNETVTLRLVNGSKEEINPDQEFNRMLKSASQEFIKAQTKLTKAAEQLKNDPKNPDLKRDYDEAMVELDKVSQSLYDSQIKYRKTYVVYYPLKQTNGTTRTPYEFIKEEIDRLKKHSNYVTDLIKEEYTPFSKHFGFKLENLIGQKKTKAE